MKRAAILAVLLLACLARAELKIVGEAKVAPNKLVKLSVEGADAKAGIIWDVSPDEAVDMADVSNPAKLQFAAPAGTYRVQAMAIKLDATGKTTVERQRITVIIGAPTPPPVPPPVPPAPVPGGMRVLITYESGELTKLPPGQHGVLFSAKVREYLNAKCPGGANGWKEWRMYDKDTDVKEDGPLWEKLMATAKGKAQPWITISDGAKVVHEGALPSGIEEAMLLLKQYGG